MDGPLTGTEARQSAARFLAEHCPWADTDAVLLVVSELVTNASRHTGALARLRLRVDAGGLAVEVEDADPRAPVPRTPDLGGGGGFGWHMVERLAEQLSVRPSADGKCIAAGWAAPTAV
ncbi:MULTISPECIES: ATP-binding protein [unclassified Streptomyces]|uniref:ATP-binding protein n=1 Tax=unclassified Streptomyces TaxID=2593676 RepID=UPI000DC5621B|nr:MULTISPECIES: ATP-binding protein [unclassified Streptomyces]RAJ79688.1 anti-sigma regulatory factor (Ser/Thr protein kinase) [Streptomyces sp. PsTaAH-137]